jgi:prepilin-type N-terminal cleavage/methylation domain-containing protein
VTGFGEYVKKYNGFMVRRGHLSPSQFISNERGFTLIEVLVAVALLGLVAAGLLGALVTQTKASSQADTRTKAESLAYSSMEQIKASSYMSAVTTGSDGIVASYNVSAPSNSKFVIWTLNNAATPTYVARNNVVYGIPYNVNTSQTTSTDTGVQKVTVAIQFGGTTIFTLVDFVSK